MRPALIALAAALAASACARAPDPGPGAARLDPPGWRTVVDTDLNAFFDCLEAAGARLASAHRGGPKPGFPENALETMAETLRFGPAILEVDIATSADGVLFLLHDDTLERTTTGEGAAGAQLWEEIVRLRLEDNSGAETPFAPTRLDAALAWAEGRAILSLDIKKSTRYEAVAEAVRAARAERRVMVIAYTLAQAERLHRLLPETMISLNINSQSELNRAVAAGIPADRLIAFTGTREPSPRLFNQMAAQKVETIFGTLGGADSFDAAADRANDPAIYLELAEAGVDIIATDRPIAVEAALRSAGRAASDGLCGIRGP